MRFELICEKLEPKEDGTTEQVHYMFDSSAGKLWLDEKTYIGLDNQRISLLTGDINTTAHISFEDAWENNLPGKVQEINRLKIQMGMSCNYSCMYCSQRFVERPEQGTPEKVDGLIEKVQKNLKLPKYGKGLKIEFWGGEPLVYWKTLKPMAEKLRVLYPMAIFSIITNGSLLTKEIADWLEAYGFSMSISHDGPGQHVRGPDPIAENKEIFDYVLQKFKGKISFGSMLNRNNTSRKEIRDWFDNLFPQYSVPIGEGGLIDAYDEDGYELALQTKAEHFAFRKQALQEILQTKDLNFASVKQRLEMFISVMVENRPLVAEKEQKCGMDSKTSMAIDMQGDIITCQNTSAVATAMNGMPHKLGNLEDLASVKLHSATHWTARPHCQKCPVVSVCSGNCMYIQGDKWFRSCDNAYTDNIVLFALAVLQLTGYLPVFIDAPGLPDHRKDIWGSILEHKEEPAKKEFKIPVVAA
jgi:uncharacterized protein